MYKVWGIDMVYWVWRVGYEDWGIGYGYRVCVGIYVGICVGISEGIYIRVCVWICVGVCIGVCVGYV